MADFKDVRTQLEKRRAELQDELERVSRTLTALAEAERLLGLSRKKESSETTQSGEAAELESLQDRGPFTPDEISALAREVLLQRGRPLKRGALVRAIEARGLTLPGKDKAKNLGTILWRHKQDFVHIEKFGYWPRDVKFAEAYDPNYPPDRIYSPRLKSQ